MDSYEEKWRALDEQISAWGRYIERMKDKADIYSEQFLLDMERQYLKVRQDFSDLKLRMNESMSATGEQTENLQKSLWEQTETQMELANANFDYLCTLARENTEKFEDATKEQADQFQEGYEKMSESFTSAWRDLVEGMENSLKKYK